MWWGERFTPRIGTYRGRADEDEFDLLAKFVTRCGFFDWKAEYSLEVEVTDTPTFVLSATRGNETNVVTQRGTDEPPDFWALAGLVDYVANQIEWVEVKAPTRRRGLSRGLAVD